MIPTRRIRGIPRKLLAPLRAARTARDKARGIRADVPLPFDMFDDLPQIAAEASSARKLERLYHKGQRLAWNGKEVLPELIARHGGIQLDAEQRRALQGLFAVILWGELAAWKISSELAVRLEPLEAKLAATSQAHDEARHFYVMHDYLALLGEVPKGLGPRTTRVLLGTLQASTLTKKLVGMQMMIEPMALALFQMVRHSRIEPVLCDLIELYERDEARHVALGVLHLPRLLKGMTRAEALDLWAWEFGEYWNQLAMLRELEPHFRVLGIDAREVIEIGRSKQIRANLLLVEELGAPLRVHELFIRFFDAKAAWDWPELGRRDVRGRLEGAWRAASQGTEGVPEGLTQLGEV
jgi:hypothetical protein